VTCRYDTAEIDLHDNNMRDSFDRIEKAVPKVNRAVFDSHDRIQDVAVGSIHDAITRTAKNVDTVAVTSARTASTLQNIEKAMKAVRENTIEPHVIHSGPAPLQTGVTDPISLLPKIGDIADRRDAGLSRIAAEKPAPAPAPAPKK